MSRRRGPFELRAPIEALDDDGLGTGTWQREQGDASSRPVHLRNALPGERVLGRVLKRRKGAFYGDAVEVLASSHPERRPPACPAFPRCGGCAYHHLSYDAQLAHKASRLERELRRVGVAPDRWAAPVSHGRLGYRRKARLGVRRVGTQVLVGFRESFSNRVARLDGCPVLTPELSALIEPLKRLIGALSVADAVPQVEVAEGDRRIALILRHLAPLDAADRSLLAAFESEHRVDLLLQSGGPDSVVTLTGAAPSLLGYALTDFGLYLQFDPRQFTQVNFAMNRELVRRAVGYLQPLRGRRVADLFCGIGNFSLALARAGAHVIGLELDDTAVERARENATLNGLDCTFEVSNLYGDASPPPADAWLLDPPRSGAGEGLSSWLTSGDAPRDIVYVSCNPVSFADDASTIVDHGFVLTEVGILDMFPHTGHVETLGCFRRA